jgi:hypothetical protein
MVEGPVKKSRFSEQQIIEILKLAEAGTGGGFVPQARDQPVDEDAGTTALPRSRWLFRVGSGRRTARVQRLLYFPHRPTASAKRGLLDQDRQSPLMLSRPLHLQQGEARIAR